MSKLIKRYFLIGAVVCSCCFCVGCTGRQVYHDGNGKEWIMEQLAQGKITQAQADELLKQEE